MKKALRIIIFPAFFILAVLEPVSRFLSGTARIIATAIGAVLFLVVVINAALGIAPTPECIRNGIIIIPGVTAINLTAVIPALLRAARTALSEKLM